MKVKIIPSPKSSKEFTVELQQGAQYFRLDYTGNKAECQWYAKMFRVALKKALAEDAKTPGQAMRKVRKLHKALAAPTDQVHLAKEA